MVFAFVAITAPLAQEASPAQAPAVARLPHVAVLTFGGDATTTIEQRNSISDRFSMELIESGKFTVLDRTRIDEILKEQGFQQTGSCTGGDCQVEMGRLLGVEKLVTGTVVDFGGVWSMGIGYTDVASGQVEKRVSKEIDGKLIDLLTKGCPTVAKELAGWVNRGNPGISAPVAAPDHSVAAASAKEAAQAAAAPQETRLSASTMKWLIAGGLMAMGLGAATYGYLQDKAIQDAQDTYNNLPYTATSAQFAQAAADAEDVQKQKSLWRTVGYGAGGLLLAGGVVVAVWF
jgi:hypothetical protein